MFYLIPGIYISQFNLCREEKEALAGRLKLVVIVNIYLIHHKLLLLLQSHIAGDWCMRRFASKNEIYIICLKKILACVRMPCIIFVDSKAQGAVESKDVFSSAGTQQFPGNSLFRLFPTFPPLFPVIRGKKDVILGRDKETSSPGSPCTTLSTRLGFVQAFGQSFSVIFNIAVAVAFTASLNYYRG